MARARFLLIESFLVKAAHLILYVYRQRTTKKGNKRALVQIAIDTSKRPAAIVTLVGDDAR